MNNPLGVSPSIGNQGTTRGKKIFDFGGNRTHALRIRSTVTLPTELRGRTEIVGDDLGAACVDRKYVSFCFVFFFFAFFDANCILSTLYFTSEIPLYERPIFLYSILQHYDVHG